jgi:hypothetical protein
MQTHNPLHIAYFLLDLQGNKVKTDNREAVKNFTASYLAAGMTSPLPSLTSPRGGPGVWCMACINA